MALLVFLLPARPRASSAPAPSVAGELAWVLSADGVQISRQGSSPPGQAPTADTVVAVLPATDLAWHRLSCPRAPAAKLRAALGGLLEEQLLDDEGVHLALAPGHSAGQPTWVAALHKPWLQAQLALLAAAGRPVDRVVPAWAPGGTPAGHFFTPWTGPTADNGPGSDAPAGVWLALADADQALCLPLAGGQAPALLARWRETGTPFSATPSAAAPAERALGAAVGIRSDAEWALAAARSPWQLLQFDLAPSRRGTRLLGSALQQLRSPAWRPVRWGLAALAVVQVLGLNAHAWQLQQGLQQRREAMVALLRSAHPQVRAVLDAPVQMQRETALLREAAGVPADSDFEPLLGALASAWPDGQPAATQLRYEAGRLSLPAQAFSPPQIDQLRQRLRAGGWQLDQAEGQLSVRPAPPPSP